MRKVAIIGVALGCLLGSTAAEASYYLSQKQAEHYTRDKLHWDLGYHHTVAICRPQGHNRPAPGYVYHRWICGWAAGDSSTNASCIGTSRVSGSSQSGTYYWHVLYHRGECPYGTS